MAVLIDHPDEVSVPQFADNNEPPHRWRDAVADYEQRLRDHCRAVLGEDHWLEGTVLRIPVDDGYANYMIVNVGPLALIHEPITELTAPETVEALEDEDVEDWARWAVSCHIFSPDVAHWRRGRHQVWLEGTLPREE